MLYENSWEVGGGTLQKMQPNDKSMQNKSAKKVWNKQYFLNNINNYTNSK